VSALVHQLAPGNNTLLQLFGHGSSGCALCASWQPAEQPAALWWLLQGSSCRVCLSCCCCCAQKGKEGVQEQYEQTDEFHERWRMKARDLIGRSAWRRQKLAKRVGVACGWRG
jgi:hypothetical protein